MACRDLKMFPRRTVSDKVLRLKAFNIVKNVKYDGYETGLFIYAEQILSIRTLLFNQEKKIFLVKFLKT